LDEKAGIRMHGNLQWAILLKWLRRYAGKDTVTFKFLVPVAPITKRLVPGPPATAECNFGTFLE
jgi:hypothetical protein